MPIPLHICLFERKALMGILTILLWINSPSCKAQNEERIRGRAEIDFRSVNFEDSNVTLDTAWEFYWQQFRTEPDLSKEPILVNLPSFWTNHPYEGSTLPALGYGTYCITVILPASQEKLALKLPDINSAYRLYAGDSLLVEIGHPDSSAGRTIPYWNNQIVPISGDTIQLALQIANFHHSRGGGMLEHIELGLLSRLQHSKTINNALDWFLTGLIFIMGFLFLGLYIFSERDSSLLYFGLFCMLYSYRIVGSTDYPLHDVFTSLNWTWAIHLEYLSLFLSVSMFVLYTKTLFPKDAPKKLLSIMAIVGFIFTAITVLTPPLVFSKLIDSFMWIVFLYICLAFQIYHKAYYNRRIGAKFALLSTLGICTLVIFLILEYYGIVHLSKSIIFISYLAFFVCQSLILPFRFAYILNKTKEKALLGLKAKNEFLSTMSHEIRTPLNSVIGMAHIMQSENPREDQKSHLDVLLFAANNLLGIVNNILDLNKMEAGQLTLHAEPTNLDSIAKKVMLGIKAASSNQEVAYIQNTNAVAGLLVLTDGQKFAQILANLLGNASKFTNKGQISCSITVTERNEQSITLRISVSDTGIGIPQEKQGMIFDRFTQVDSTFTRNFEGAGLGLSITKQILQIQGASLQLNSIHGQGSDFYWTQTFLLAKPPVSSQKHAQEGLLPMSGIQILIVEDIKMNIIVLQKFLSKWGAGYDIATNGQEALDKFDTTRHHLILMDLHMPVMDGFQATKVLRQRSIKVPILALTADVGALEEIERAGMNDLILKPYNPQKLLETLLQHLQKESFGQNQQH